ncbi:MAG TPA: VanZ family protein [Thermoanaerobaculia bacterium]|nr:VanZ family protein [Thermoanaerobaculia bacterium]
MSWADLLLGLLASALLLAAGLAGVVLFAVKLPAAYFLGEEPPKPLWADEHPVVRWTGRILKNLAGLVAVALGLVLAMPGVPGPGLLTILLGVMLLDFPGKRRLERWIIRRQAVRGFVDRVRCRYGKPPLVLEDARAAGGAGLHWPRLAAAIAFSAAIIAVAPFLGRLRDLVFARLPSHALLLGTVAFGALVAGAFLVAVARIRRRRWLRYGGLALCLALVWAQVSGFSTGIPAVDVVERLHIVEYGLLALLFYRAFRALRGAAAVALTSLAGILVGVLDEWLQWLVASRVGEVGDVWLNAAAVGTGLLFAICLLPPAGLQWRMAAAERSAVAALAAVTVLVFGGFYHCAHLGYEVHDPAQGVTFRSWHSAEELAAVAAQRARRWSAGRLPTLDPLSREDYYFVEGTSRVAHRNASLQWGDVGSAWSEQRILERYYAPVLAQRGLASGEPLDLPDDQRAELERRAQGLAPVPYSSPVLADRIVLVAKPLWWTAVAVLAAALLAAACYRSRER